MNRPWRDSLVPFVESACFESFMGPLQFLTACLYIGRKRRDKSLPKQTDRPHQKVHGNMRKEAAHSSSSLDRFGEQSTFYGTADTALFIQPPPFHTLVAGADPLGAIRAAVRPSAVDDLVSVRLFAVFCGHQCRRRRMKLGKVHVVRACRTARQI